MTDNDARAYLEKSIDNVEHLSDDLSWTNAEVLEMLRDAVSLFGEAHTPTDDEREAWLVEATRRYPDAEVAKYTRQALQDAFILGAEFAVTFHLPEVPESEGELAPSKHDHGNRHQRRDSAEDHEANESCDQHEHGDILADAIAWAVPQANRPTPRER